MNTSLVDNRESRRWWLKLLIQPALLLICGVAILAGIGVAQRLGWLAAGGGPGPIPLGAESVQYICPMMCTPPQAEPGRCPVCAMELVPATSGGGGDSRSIQIDPAARRVANIRTVAVKSRPMTRTIRAVGELKFDEGGLKTIAAYYDCRLDRLYADYTGAVVQQGERLALVYSPRLHSAQVEFLVAKKARETSRSESLRSVIASGSDLYETTKERLLLLGMTEAQIEELEKAGHANSRTHLLAPISGTVIEKLAVEGEYVKEGDAIYRLADLSNVWLMLRLFPEDAAMVQVGQEAGADVQSLPGRKFTGKVAFIDPSVDPTTRTVGVRVVIPNPEGALRAGDYAKATIAAPVAAQEIVPPDPIGEVLVVPRDAVLLAGASSVVYVETEPGRFEMRRVVLGPSCGDEIVIVRGVARGEQVAARGNFLIDSQMQLAGNPSLIDPTKADRTQDEMILTDLPPIGVPQLLESMETAVSNEEDLR